MTVGSTVKIDQLCGWSCELADLSSRTDSENFAATNGHCFNDRILGIHSENFAVEDYEVGWLLRLCANRCDKHQQDCKTSQLFCSHGSQE